MAQEIVTWCDPCMAVGNHEPGVPEGIYLAGRRPEVIDLCKHHREDLLQPVIDVLEAHGRPADGAPRKGRQARSTPAPASTGATADDHPCIWCGRTYDAGTSLANHLRSAHGIPRQQIAPTCPECGTATSRLGAHTVPAHGRSAYRSILAGRDAGDPFGVYAAVIARAERLPGAP